MNDALKHFSRSFLPPGGITEGEVAISSLTGCADAFLALYLATNPKPRVVLAITDGLPLSDRLVDDLKLLSSQREIIPSAFQARIMEFPPLLGGDKSALGIRLKSIAAIKSWELNPYPLVIVAPYLSLATAFSSSTNQSFILTPGKILFTDLLDVANRFGYQRVPMVEKEGDWSVRGGIVDIWSPGEEFPVRAEFFGDDLESLRMFEVSTQCSIRKISSAELLPVDVDSEDEEKKSCYLTDMLPSGYVALLNDHNAYDGDKFLAKASFKVFVGDPSPASVPTCRFQTVPLPGFAELDITQSHNPELVDSAKFRIERHLKTAQERGDNVCTIDGLSGGFELPPLDGGPSLLVVTKSDKVFVKRKVRRRVSNARTDRLNTFEELEVGEYVVHIEYGVGRFVGSSEIVIDGKRTEVFTVEYDGGAKLHVNASQAHLLSRYVGVKGQEVRLHKLDGKKWNKDRLDAQRSVEDLAATLLRTQAERESVAGFSYEIDCDGRDAFEGAFPYEETPDQIAAIRAIEKDLSSTKPMDRLVCGDAGYGKTEVAMRAAYIAAMNGRQTAVLAPTTVLAEQHFETFSSRFYGTPIRIESVSRFQSAKTHEGTFSRIASGVCDIVIGTHAILTSKISFKNLGLIIIDEEQRFGVRHKEFLKTLRSSADVLTLSATPIPRTLYMSMAGVRDLSLLSTPPRERVAVETTVTRDSDLIVKSAIDAELARGGQVFFLYNRVSTMPRVERRLKELCKDARIVIAHGRMDAKTLARKMHAFEKGEYDILLSTTIVESGIDIPRANTILVSDAHMFGLADLYQLRGRVGRSSVQGRAVFLLPSEGIIDSDARERMAALKRHGGLGGGFSLAVRDLELRGAGNLLGSQQSGHIAAIGFTLYCQLLNRTVAMLKGEKPKIVVDVKLNLDFIELSPVSENPDAAAALPYDYIEEDSLRLSFMKRFAQVSDVSEVKALMSELSDRFGRLPPQAKRLALLSELRIKCANCGVALLRVSSSRAMFYKSGNAEVSYVGDLKSKSADARIKELISMLQKVR